MKRLMLLWIQAANELAAWCHTSAVRDFKTFTDRVEHEGASFMTITLPDFCKNFERSLSIGQYDTSYTAFRCRGGLPLFLRGFLCQVFDERSGSLVDSPNVDAILAIRQLCLMFKKLRLLNGEVLNCTDARRDKALEAFVNCESEVASAIDTPYLDSFQRVGRMLFGDAFSAVDREIYNGELTPKHGPGVTADRLLGNEKYDQFEWTDRLENVFSFSENAVPASKLRLGAEGLDYVLFREPDAERPVRVITVPKTLKTPRIIAIEPTCMQFMQQAILNSIVQKMEADIVEGCTSHNLSSIFVGFTDQDPNRIMARRGSIDCSLATLDMSEASDRVSNQHVVDLVSSWPHLHEGLQAARSTKADVPGFGVIPLAKFASMGSATCFPMEAAVFCTAVFVGIEQWLNRPLTRSDIMSFSGKVRVYGDDIIVPTDCVPHVLHVFEAFGFRVNMNKSFWTGKFRESCGGDFYSGVDITPTYCKVELPSGRGNALQLESAVAMRNLLYQKGMWRTAGWLDKQIGKALPFYPVVGSTSPVLGRFSFLPYQAERVHPDHQSPQVRGYRLRSKSPRSNLDGYGALMKFQLSAEGKGEASYLDFVSPLSIDAKHLERSGRPRVVGIKLGWYSPF